MSGVYIQGMDMPINEPLIIKISPDGSVSTTWKNDYKKYEIIPVPPHGRLGDLDAIMTKLNETSKRVFGNDSVPECSSLSIVADYIEAAPTIIPASKEGE